MARVAIFDGRTHSVCSDIRWALVEAGSEHSLVAEAHTIDEAHVLLGRLAIGGNSPQSNNPAGINPDGVIAFIGPALNREAGNKDAEEEGQPTDYQPGFLYSIRLASEILASESTKQQTPASEPPYLQPSVGEPHIETNSAGHIIVPPDDNRNIIRGGDGRQIMRIIRACRLPMTIVRISDGPGQRWRVPDQITGYDITIDAIRQMDGLLELINRIEASKVQAPRTRWWPRLRHRS